MSNNKGFEDNEGKVTNPSEIKEDVTVNKAEEPSDKTVEGVKEQVESVKEQVEEVKEQVETVKEQVEAVKEQVIADKKQTDGDKTAKKVIVGPKYNEDDEVEYVETEVEAIKDDTAANVENEYDIKPFDVTSNKFVDEETEISDIGAENKDAEVKEDTEEVAMSANTKEESTNKKDVKESKKNGKGKDKKEEAKENKEDKKPKAIKLGKCIIKLNKKFIAIISVLCLACIGAVAGYYMYENSNKQPIDSKTEKKLNVSIQKEDADKLEKRIDEIRNGNAYFNLIDGQDSSETYIYNSHGEAIAQGNKNNYMTVFRKDGKAARFTDTLDFGPDIEILQLMKNSLELVKSKEAVMTLPLQQSDALKGYDVYYVSLTGWDNIKKLYTPAGEELANTMIDNMKKAVPEGKEIKIRLKYVVGKDGQFSTGCELIMDGKEYTLWYFDGYLLLYDWQLPDEWYTNEFKDGAEADKMLTTLLTDLDGMFKKYADDNGLPSAEEVAAKKAEEEKAKASTDTKDSTSSDSTAKTESTNTK